MSVKANYNVQCTVVETFETQIDGLNPDDKSVTHGAFNSHVVLNAGTTPPATKVCSWIETMSGGADAVDFTSLIGPLGAITGVDLKVQVIKIVNKTGNSAITIVPGGYDLLGAAFKIILLEGQEFTFYGNDAVDDIGAADAITITGTSPDEVEIIVVMG